MGSTRKHDDGETVDQLIHAPENWWNLQFCYQYVCVSLVWILYGFDVGIVSSLLGYSYFIASFQGGDPTSAVPLAFTPLNINLLVPVAVVGTALAPFVAPKVQSHLGRRATFLVAFGLCCTPASFLQLFAYVRKKGRRTSRKNTDNNANDNGRPNIGVMSFARAWNFFGISLGEQVCAPYVVEMVPSKYRATFLGTSTAFNQIFTVITTIVGFECSKLKSHLQWKIPLAIQCALPIVISFACLTLLESPSWLISKGRLQEATANLAKLRRNGHDALVEAEIAAMVAAYEEETSKSRPGLLIIFSQRHLKRTITSALVSCTTSVSGYSLTATYGVVILIKAGVSSPFEWNIGNSVLAFAGVIIGSQLYDRIGRRPILITGFCLVSITNFIAGGIAFTGLRSPTQGKSLASISILLSFIVNITFASNYTLQAEIPTLALRDYTIAYCTFCNSVSTIIVYFIIPYLLSEPANLGPKTYLVFGGSMVLATVAAYFLIPETRNRSCLEIDEMYENRISVREWKTYECQGLESKVMKVINDGLIRDPK